MIKAEEQRTRRKNQLYEITSDIKQMLMEIKASEVSLTKSIVWEEVDVHTSSFIYSVSQSGVLIDDPYCGDIHIPFEELEFEHLVMILECLETKKFEIIGKIDDEA